MRSVPRRVLQGLLAASGPALALAWVAGRALLDEHRALIAFFLLPAPLVAVACAAWFPLGSRHAPRGIRMAMLPALAGILVHVLGHDVRWRATPAAPENALRIVHWNVARLPLATGQIQNVLRADAPDICLLSETLTNPVIATAGATLNLPYVHFAQSMTLLSRFPIVVGERLTLPEARGWCARLNTPSGPLDLVAVDVVSKPQLDRRPAMSALADWVKRHDQAVPLLILGDFNTPSDSVAFRPLRARLAHGYETAGRGWAYSWPLPAPMYAIDHAWYTRDTVSLFAYRLKSAPISDHRRQTMQAVLHPGKTGV